MKRNVLILFAANLLISAINAQEITDPRFREFQLDFRQSKTFRGERPVYDGTPYLFENFSEGRIVTKSGKTYAGIPLNYNIYNDDFEYLLDSIEYTIENKDMIAFITLYDRNFYIKSYTNKSVRVTGYLEQLSEGRYKVFLKHRVVFTEAEAPQPYTEAKNARFSTRRPDYFIDLGDEIIFFNSLSEMAELFPEHEAGIKKHIKGNKLKFKRDEDIIALADYISQQGY